MSKPRVLDDSELDKISGGCPDNVCDHDKKESPSCKPATGSGGLTGSTTGDADDDPIATLGGSPNQNV